jgi:hypothetical protein
LEFLVKNIYLICFALLNVFYFFRRNKKVFQIGIFFEKEYNEETEGDLFF